MKKIAVLASGNGTNFEALVLACKSGFLNAKIVLLVCDNAAAFAVERAKKLGIPTFVFSPKAFATKADYEREILAKLVENQVDLICLAGYMRIVGNTLLSAFSGKILNIHPALLPAFKGAHAIDEAFRFGVKVFGVTVHLIDETIDGGTIVAQRAFEYYGKNCEEVESKIHEIEHQLYPAAVKMVLEKKMKF